MLSFIGILLWHESCTKTRLHTKYPQHHSKHKWQSLTTTASAMTQHCDSHTPKAFIWLPNFQHSNLINKPWHVPELAWYLFPKVTDPQDLPKSSCLMPSPDILCEPAFQLFCSTRPNRAVLGQNRRAYTCLGDWHLSCHFWDLIGVAGLPLGWGPRILPLQDEANCGMRQCLLKNKAAQPFPARYFFWLQRTLQ